MQLDLALISDRFKHYMVLSLCTLVLGYFMLHSVTGENGFLKAIALQGELASRKLELKSLQQDRQALETRTKLLRPNSLDLDMLDERARAQLGMTKPNEYVIYYNK